MVSSVSVTVVIIYGHMLSVVRGNGFPLKSGGSYFAWMDNNMKCDHKINVCDWIVFCPGRWGKVLHIDRGIALVSCTTNVLCEVPIACIKVFMDRHGW